MRIGTISMTVLPTKIRFCGAISVDWVMDNFTNIKTHRVLRSGSWLSYPAALPVSFRSGDTPTNTNDTIGLRCVRTSGKP